MPVLGFWGSRDRFLAVSQAMVMLDKMPHAKMVISNECGHWYMIERAGDFNREVAASLAELPWGLPGASRWSPGPGRGAAAVSPARVVIGTRTAGPGEETVAAIRDEGGEADLVTVDVASRAGCEALVAATAARHGGVDILLHNAAAFPFAPIEGLDDDALDATLALNVESCFWLTQAALSHLRRSRVPRILVTSSVSGNHATAPGLTHYSPSKSAVTGFVRNLALELAGEGITVNVVEPGFILTERNCVPEMAALVAKMVRQIPMRRAGKLADIAGAMLLLASDEAAYVTGQSIVVDGGLTLGAPGDFGDIAAG